MTDSLLLMNCVEGASLLKQFGWFLLSSIVRTRSLVWLPVHAVEAKDFSLAREMRRESLTEFLNLPLELDSWNLE